MTNPAGTPATKRSNRKGSRPKHVPVRTCVVCREQGTKRGLTRIVRAPDGSVAVDPSGRQNGRGAYLCHKRSCWERAASSDVLAKALNVGLTEAFREELRVHGSELASDAAKSGQTED